jgi:hypothetical protein
MRKTYQLVLEEVATNGLEQRQPRSTRTDADINTNTKVFSSMITSNEHVLQIPEICAASSEGILIGVLLYWQRTAKSTSDTQSQMRSILLKSHEDLHDSSEQYNLQTPHPLRELQG